MRIQKAVWTVGIMMLAASLSAAEYPADAGSSISIEFGMGTQGIMSYEEVGIRVPVGSGGFTIALSGRFMSSLTWATFTNLDTGDSVSFHPDIVAGVMSFGGASPLLHGMLRVHGATDILLGYSFTPWDSAIYGVPNLIGPNITFKSISGDKANPYVIAAGWLGSGFGIRLSMRFYL